MNHQPILKSILALTICLTSLNLSLLIQSSWAQTSNCELPDADLRQGTGFPIHWQQPPGLRSTFGLTLPPRAGVLVPKTHSFFWQPVPISLVFAYGMEGQDISSYTTRECSFPHPPRRCSTLRSELDSGVESSTHSHSSRRSALPERGEPLAASANEKVEQLLKQAQLQTQQGESQKALDYYNQALPILKETGDRSREASTLNKIGLAYYSLGDTQKSLEYFEAALTISNQIDDKSSKATILSNIGEVYRVSGQLAPAFDYLNQALVILKEVDNPSIKAITLNNLGLLYNTIGYPKKALEFYNQALPISREIGDRYGEATLLDNSGSIYLDLGELQKALDLFNQALPIFSEFGDRLEVAKTLMDIGFVHKKMGNSQMALDSYQQALSKAREIDNQEIETEILKQMQ